MMRLVLGCGLIGLVACGEPAAPAEPDGGGLVLPTAARPGPCASRNQGEFTRACTMTYDSADRISRMDCEYLATCAMDEQWTWTYDADGALALIARRTQECDTALFVYDELDFRQPFTGTERRSRAVYRAETTATYEAELVLTRHPFEDQISLLLGARDALLATHHEYEQGGPITITEHTFGYDGPPHQGVRTRTRDDGVQMTFEYDAQGRLIAASSEGDEPARTYEYDGARLIRDGAVVYQHDEFGNLVRRIDESTDLTMEYDYACWE
jgi:YD repeat-containing protein